ncbi:dehydrogenase [Stutzerimonas kirkiae]|uniref:Dehydrogenase n=1 Tax=Stutzerimonas kirkiae TaxID=2211392 RepID=A0A4Q9QZV5_9GAMM|nr:FAD-dependent oxidoreductase [Stutzerimonas kirkiae]TBU90058.1 dehydrogenase [Stutzerimonas kirkiae]TBU98215.1 dehydrogenase [Stutzerimonas kirkiae]TBV10183.1 dehydrogenase [Stutzerimonas kirkiae]
MNTATHWHERFDLIVVGSGASGLGAALSAAREGARVVVVEQSSLVGGASAFSGALLWVPVNPKAAALSIHDDRERALRYIAATCGGGHDAERAAVYVEQAGPTCEFLEAASPLRLRNTPYPDSFVEAEGGLAQGRHLEPAPFALRSLGAWRQRLRRPLIGSPLTSLEVKDSGLLWQFRRALLRQLPRILWRGIGDRRPGGLALVGALLKGCLDAGVRIQLDSRVSGLQQDPQGRVVGVELQTPQGALRWQAGKGVILANGGFEWNPRRVRQHLPVELEMLPTPPLANGDNLLLAEQAGAQLENLDSYWHWPTGEVPGLHYEGRALGILSVPERSLPHSLWVNRHGRRFVNEASHNCSLALEERDPASGEYRNLPAWAIFDDNFRQRYPVLLKAMPGSRDPDWLVGAPSLAALAERIGVPATALEASVARFNLFAADGQDPDFGRGSFAYDHFMGDPRSPNPNLGPLERAPYYALPVHPSAVGTRGGARTDGRGRVLRADGSIVPGLYAAGNAASGFFWRNMIGGGATLMPGLVFGRLAALDALRQP